MARAFFAGSMILSEFNRFFSGDISHPFGIHSGVPDITSTIGSSGFVTLTAIGYSLGTTSQLAGITSSGFPFGSGLRDHSFGGFIGASGIGFGHTGSAGFGQPIIIGSADPIVQGIGFLYFGVYPISSGFGQTGRTGSALFCTRNTSHLSPFEVQVYSLTQNL